MIGCGKKKSNKDRATVTTTKQISNHSLVFFDNLWISCSCVNGFRQTFLFFSVYNYKIRILFFNCILLCFLYLKKQWFFVLHYFRIDWTSRYSFWFRHWWVFSILINQIAETLSFRFWLFFIIIRWKNMKIKVLYKKFNSQNRTRKVQLYINKIPSASKLKDFSNLFLFSVIKWNNILTHYKK